tara:strand:+ start:251 stop:586 length:336 start_codon:yes stop_codon:yes gene_type:complete
MAKSYIIVQTSTNKKNISKKISSHLLKKNLAACVNIIYPVNSQYTYQGKIIDDTEYIINIKTIKSNYHKIQKTIEELHNYETPEIIALDISHGSKKFFEWIDNETDKNRDV